MTNSTAVSRIRNCHGCGDGGGGADLRRRRRHHPLLPPPSCLLLLLLLLAASAPLPSSADNVFDCRGCPLGVFGKFATIFADEACIEYESVDEDEDGNTDEKFDVDFCDATETNDVDYNLDTGEEGGDHGDFIDLKWWDARAGTDRWFRLEFCTNDQTEDGTSPEEKYADAERHGWFLCRVASWDDGRGDDGVIDFKTDRHMPYDVQRTQVRVPDSTEYLWGVARQVEYPLYGSDGTRIATLVLKGGIVLSAFQTTEYALPSENWNICERENFKSELLRASQGRATCGGRPVPEDADGMDVEDSSEDQELVICRTDDVVSGEPFYFRGHDMNITIEEADDASEDLNEPDYTEYSFCYEGQNSWTDNRVESDKFDFVYTWMETDDVGKERDRQFMFRWDEYYSSPDNDRWHISEIRVLDNEEEDMVWKWNQDDEGLKEDQKEKIREDLTLETDFEIFECENVLIRLGNKDDNSDYQANFTIKNFRLSRWLTDDLYDKEEGYESIEHMGYNPCAGGPSTGDSGQICYLILPPSVDTETDGGVRCGGTSFEDPGTPLAKLADRDSQIADVVNWNDFITDGQSSYSLRAEDVQFKFDDTVGRDNNEWEDYLVPSLCEGEGEILYTYNSQWWFDVGCSWYDEYGLRDLLFMSDYYPFGSDSDTIVFNRAIASNVFSRTLKWNYLYREPENEGHSRNPLFIIPRNSTVWYDGFECDEVKLNFETLLVGQPGGYLTMQNFKMAVAVTPGKNVNSLNYFNPCGRGNSCKITDNVLKCNNVQRYWSDVYNWALSMENPTSSLRLEGDKVPEDAPWQRPGDRPTVWSDGDVLDISDIEVIKAGEVIGQKSLASMHMRTVPIVPAVFAILLSTFVWA